jgi:hypothetical protein
MKQTRFGFPIAHLAGVEMLRFCSIFLATIFFAGCETTKKDEADTNTVIREPDKSHEIHGEVGAMYGGSAH